MQTRSGTARERRYTAIAAAARQRGEKRERPRQANSGPRELPQMERADHLPRREKKEQTEGAEATVVPAHVQVTSPAKATAGVSSNPAGGELRAPAQPPQKEKKRDGKLRRGYSDMSSAGSHSDTSSRFSRSGGERGGFTRRFSADSASDNETAFTSASEVSAMAQENRELKLRLQRMEHILVEQAERERRMQQQMVGVQWTRSTHNICSWSSGITTSAPF